MVRTSFLLSIASLLAACGGEPEFAPQPGPPDAGQDAAPTPPPPLPDAGAGDAAPPSVATGPCDGTMTLAVTSMFEGRRKAEAPGMEPEGTILCGTVPEGQTVSSQVILLQPGHCYTFLGQALPNVTEIDMSLVFDPAASGLPPPLAAMVGNPLLLQDNLSGQLTSMAAKKDCYKQALIPAALPAKLIIKARTGSGPIAAQIYKKKSP